MIDHSRLIFDQLWVDPLYEYCLVEHCLLKLDADDELNDKKLILISGIDTKEEHQRAVFSGSTEEEQGYWQQ
ncbi:MAG: hypothetical protein ACFE0I_16150 [Elainellaceae cyanobacterium]